MVLRRRHNIYTWRDSKDKLPGEIGISVMRGHTDNEGKNPDPNIFPDSFTEHIQNLGPPRWLVAWWYQGNKLEGADIERREEMFGRDYINYLRTPEPLALAKGLIRRAMTMPIAILCKEPFPQFCHRHLLTEFLRRLSPTLPIGPPLDAPYLRRLKHAFESVHPSDHSSF